MSFTPAIAACLSDPDPFMPYYPCMEMLCREQTPGQGKMIFPEMAFNIIGLESEKKYEVLFSLERLENKKYKYDSKLKQWKKTKHPEKSHEYKKLSKGNKTGDEWNKEPFAVPEARITNKKTNNDKYTFYLTPLHKYVPVLYIRDMETLEEHRVAVEFAQFIPVTKYYDQELSDWKASMNKFSTVRNNGPGKETMKRKAAENENEAPKAKRTPLQEQQVPEFNLASLYDPTLSSTATFPVTYSNPCYNPQFNYQAAPGIAHCYPSTSTFNNMGYSNQQYHYNYFQNHNYNFQYHQYPSTPMTNYAPSYTDYSTPLPKPITSTPTVSPNTQLHDENSNFVQMYIGPQFH